VSVEVSSLPSSDSTSRGYGRCSRNLARPGLPNLSSPTTTTVSRTSIYNRFTWVLWMQTKASANLEEFAILV